MSKKILSALLAGAIFLSFPIAAEACKDKQSSCMKCAMKEEKCKVTKLKKKVKMLWEGKKELGLDEAQLEKIKEIKLTAVKKLITEQAEIDVVKVDLKSAMWAEMMDLSAVNKLVSKKYSAKEALAKTYVKAISDIQKVLNEDQRAAWKMMLKDKKCSKSECGKCKGKNHSDCGKASCAKCNKEKDGRCPITGKPLESSKGSMKGSM